MRLHVVIGRSGHRLEEPAPDLLVEGRRFVVDLVR